MECMKCKHYEKACAERPCEECKEYSDFELATMPILLERVCGKICDDFCIYKDTNDENAECEWIRKGNKCPLDFLY